MQDTVYSILYHTPQKGLVHPRINGKKQALVYMSGWTAEYWKGVVSGATLPGLKPACAIYFPC